MLITFKRPLHPELTSLVDASSLEVARLVSSVRGYYDVDLQPQEPGRVTVTAQGKDRKLHFSGATNTEACNKLIEALCGT